MIRILCREIRNTYQRHILLARNTHARRLNEEWNLVIRFAVNEKFDKRRRKVINNGWVGNAVDNGAIQAWASDSAIDRLGLISN